MCEEWPVFMMVRRWLDRLGWSMVGGDILSVNIVNID